jgi:hypothetical protein
MASARPRWRALGATALAAVLGCGDNDRRDPATAFAASVREYVAIARRAGGEPRRVDTIDEARAEDVERVALAGRIRGALPDWRNGRIFTAPVAQDFRARIARVLDGSGGRDVRGAILDSDPTGVRAAPLVSYPEAAPLSSMPPAILAVLPALPEEVEYRFVGHDLIVRDVRANLVVDVLEDAFR